MEDNNTNLIDLSQMRYVPPAKPKLTVEDVKQCMEVFEETMYEAINTRFECMQKMAVAMVSRVAPLPGHAHPAQDLQQRIQFLDKSMVRLTDLIVASRVLIEHAEDRIDLSKLPAMYEKIQDAIDTIVANRDKDLTQTTAAEGMLIMGFRDLDKYLNTLSYCKPYTKKVTNPQEPSNGN